MLIYAIDRSTLYYQRMLMVSLFQDEKMKFLGTVSPKPPYHIKILLLRAKINTLVEPRTNQSSLSFQIV